MTTEARRREDTENAAAAAAAAAGRQPHLAPLVATKLHAPSRVAAYRDRPRLGPHLDHALDDATRLTLLSAPPGYGKSVAVAGWLATRDVARAWLSLDAADNDPVRFTRYLVAALESVRPGIAGVVAALLESVPGPEGAAILIDAIGASDEQFVLVLDDYHAIVAEPVHALVRSLIEYGPPFAHLVLITREDPPFALPRLRANRRLVELRADELRYTADEAAAYLGESSGFGLDEEHLGRLVERTEGWIAGLQLASVSMRDRPDAASLVDAFAGTQRFVLDYLAAEVLDGVGSDLRDFLVRISVADRFTAELCRTLSGRDDSAALLERAEHLNLFLIPLDLERRCYRFHHLFADYLRTLLDPADEITLRERAADFLEAAGSFDEAIGQALAAHSTERAVRLLERHARPTYAAGEMTTLLRWIHALPAERVAASPELIAYRAWACFNVGRVEDAARACAEGEAACLDGAVPGRLLAVRALIAAFAVRPDAVALAQAAVDALGGDTLFLPVALQALAAGHLNAGDFEPAARAARTSLTAVAGTGRSSLVVPAMTSLVSALSVTGHRAEAEAICRQTLADHREEASRMAGGTPYALYWLGMVRYEANDLTGALADMERAWTATGTFGFGRAMFTSAVTWLALARQASGLPEGALDAVRTVRRDARAGGLTGIDGSLAAIEARVILLQGDLGRAGRWADSIVPAHNADATAAHGWPAISEALTGARVRIAQARTSEAGAFLRRARAAATVAGDVADLISVAVLEASLAESTHDRRRAQRALDEAVTLAAPERYIRRLVDDGRGLTHLLPAVRRIAPAFVDEVTAALAAVAPGRGALARPGGPLWQDVEGQLVEALTARELDVLRLMARGCGDAAIADELVVSLATAKWHAAHIRAKLGARSRTQALVRAQQLGLV